MLSKFKLAKTQAGATLAEVLVAIGLLGIILPTLSLALITANSARPTNEQKLQASSLLREATEVLRSLRSSDWNNIAVDGTYHPEISDNGWALVSGSEVINGLTRQIVIDSTQRDSSGAIVSSGGTVDPSTKHIVASVSWSKPVASSVTNDFYLTRWQNETAWIQTSQADFSAAMLTNITITNTNGGEAQLTDFSGQATGTAESVTFNAGRQVSFNRLLFTATIPSGTSLQLQIASNNDNATWNYVGPDGTGSTFYTASGDIPLSAVSGQYIRFKATLNAGQNSTPVLEDVTITYSN